MVWGETDCQLSLRRADVELLTKVVTLMAQQDSLPPEQFHEQLLELRERELNLFKEAKACNFTDPVERNYWYRGRMKFPSTIGAGFIFLFLPKRGPLRPEHVFLPIQYSMRRFIGA